MTMARQEEWFRIEGISKSFGKVRVLHEISLELKRGEILGLVGENGAGKSTLINIATGVHQPDEGRMVLAGREYAPSTPKSAVEAGIAVVHQEAELFSDLSLAENMLLGAGLPSGPLGWIRWKETYESAGRALSEFGMDLPVRTKSRNLSVAQRVLAQIASAVRQDASVLFLDEPTASLTHRESRILFDRIRQLKNKGVGVVYVSHRLEEVLDLCDRVAVLRDGCHVWTRPADTLTVDEMVQAMVGRNVSQYYPRRNSVPGEVSLEVRNLTDAEGAFRDVSFVLRKGEILGVYGLVGAGRTEVAQALFGLRRTAGGEVLREGLPVGIPRPGAALSKGIAYLPEDRLTQGVFRNLSVRENAVMAVLRRICSFGVFVSSGAEMERTERVVRQTQVKTEGVEAPIGTLSGGNQQKVVLGRWLETEPEILLLDEPTRGVDVGAKAEIHELIANLAGRDKAVLLISSELPEVMAMTDRVLVMTEGKIAGEFDPKTDSPEKIAAAAFPQSDEDSRRLPARRNDAASGGTERNIFAKFDLSSFREAGIGIALAGLMATIALLRPESFLTFSNFSDVLSSVSILAVAALGATFVIGGGGIDISVGSMLGLVGATAGMAVLKGVPVLLCLLLAVGLGAALGALNMGVSLIGRVHPIIVTLAGLSIYRGLMRQLTGGYEVAQLPEGYRALGDGTLLGVPRVVWFALAVLIVAWVLLQRMTFGRKILAIGNSASAAAQIGLPRSRLLILSFAVNGAFIGLASVLWGAYYGKLQTTAGEGLELQAIAAAVIGGCNIMGGSGTALGTFLGACLIGVINNALTLLQIETYWQPVFIGFFILITVLVDGWLVRKVER